MQEDVYTSYLVHDLRTPLTSINGHAELLKDGIYGDLNEEQNRSVDIIIEQVNVLKVLITDVLDAAKGIVSVFPEQTDIALIVRTVIDSLAPIARRKHILLVFNNPRACITAVDPKRIRQVIVNLIDNAIKFSEEHSSIEINCLWGTTEFRIEIIDHGRGIDALDIKKLFNRFAQIGPQQQGNGIGLVVSKLIVEKHGGTLSVESKKGHGSKFSVNLPCKCA